MQLCRRLSAAIVLAAAFCCCSFSVPAAPYFAGPPDGRFIYFTGIDLWRAGDFFHGGILWAPHGNDKEGVVLKTMVSGGWYRYLSGALSNADVTGREFNFQLLPGWRFKRGSFELKIFAGLELRHHALSPDDPGASLNGDYAGLRTAMELWYEPTPQSMAALDASVSTIGQSYNARGALGWRVFDKFYLGPEIATYASDDYRQFRAGLHITAFKSGPIEWSAGAGFVRDSDRRSGAYGRIGALIRR